MQGSATQRGSVFILLWLPVQLVRVAGLSFGWLTDDAHGRRLLQTMHIATIQYHQDTATNISRDLLNCLGYYLCCDIGATVVGLFVFIDKYSGPLGNAAVEAALLLSIAGATSAAAATGTKETASLENSPQKSSFQGAVESGFHIINHARI